jgi:hypothetical protein
MQIRRGPDGQGINTVKCSSCHQDHNLAGARMPPGAPDWRLPPPETPMIWDGLTDRELCELLKDRSRTDIARFSRSSNTCHRRWCLGMASGRRTVAHTDEAGCVPGSGETMGFEWRGLSR